MNSLLTVALLVVTTLVAVTDSVVVLATGTTVGVSAAGLAAGALAVKAVAAGAGLLALKAKRQRHRRETAPSCAPFDNSEMYFTLAANGDFLDCGRRFVCELEATPDENLAQEEVLISNLFGEWNVFFTRRDSIVVNGSAANYYAEAGRLGAVEGVDACVTAFSKCPFDRKTILLGLKEVQTA